MHVRRTLALALAVPLLLAGCTDEPTPKIPEPTTPSPTTPSPSESETPEQESPEDFIRRWVDANTEMQNTGQIDEYVELSRGCSSCVRTAQNIREIYDNGGEVRTEGWKIEEVIDRTAGAGAPVVDLKINSSPTEYRERAGAKVESLPGGEIVMRVRLSKNEPWRVVRLTQVPS